jgi:cytochrome c biogenesis protein CcmG/thiol:disulfide interchange protein DsbE
MNRSWLLWIPLAVVAFFGGLAIFGLAEPEDTQVHSAMIGKKLPEFALPAATAGVPALSNTDMADGKPRLLNIFCKLVSAVQGGGTLSGGVEGGGCRD